MRLVSEREAFRELGEPATDCPGIDTGAGRKSGRASLLVSCLSARAESSREKVPGDLTPIRRKPPREENGIRGEFE
jgi:hypothetical protein